MLDINLSHALQSWWTDFLGMLTFSSLSDNVLFSAKIGTCDIYPLVLEGSNTWPIGDSVRFTFQFGKSQWFHLKTLYTFYLNLLIENYIYFACLHYFKVSFKILKPRVAQYGQINQKIIRMKFPSKLHVF